MAREPDGYTKLDHLKAAWRASKVMPQELRDRPSCPSLVATTWLLFLDLHVNRQSGFGPSRITYMDLQARQIVTGYALTDWERQAVNRLDTVYMEFLAEQEAKKPKPK